MLNQQADPAVDESGQPVLSIRPAHHQRTALYVGSKEPVTELAEVLKKHL